MCCKKAVFLFFFKETKALLEQEENLLDKVDDVDSDLERMDEIQICTFQAFLLSCRSLIFSLFYLEYVQRLDVILKHKIENFTNLRGIQKLVTRKHIEFNFCIFLSVRSTIRQGNIFDLVKCPYIEKPALNLIM